MGCIEKMKEMDTGSSLLMIKEFQKASTRMEVWRLARTINTCYLGLGYSTVYGEGTPIDVNILIRPIVMS